METKENIDHGTRAHALLSASGASRWMKCTASPRLEEGFPEHTSSYAQEGTLAHEFAELEIKLALKLITKQHYDNLTAPLRQSEFYTDEMEDEVQKYVDFVLETFTEAKTRAEEAVIKLEEKIDLTEYIEDGFGSNDTVIIANQVLDVIDLKYGKGVRVNADNNPQLMLYGLGSLRLAELLFDIKTVRLTIVQPRLDHVSIWEISVDDLKAWGNDEVIPKAKMAYAGEGPQIPGDHCRFCKVKARCVALADQNLSLAQHEFAEPKLLTDEQLIDAYKKAPQLQDWISAISQYLYDEAMKGKKWDGYKLVEGRSNRTWVDPAKVKEALNKGGFEDKEIMTDPKLQGITAIEKLVGKAAFPVLLEGLVFKPNGKPSLVPDTDKRSEYNSNEQAANDFAEADNPITFDDI